ncbi:MAG: MEKHLA domain-containing protein [Cyanobacteria bacterium P01_A01_bin.84]
MTNTNQLPWEQEKIITHTQNLLNSYQHWTGNLLLGTDGSPEEISQQLFDIPFAVVSHGTEPDPIFNYGNRKALEQWEVSWEEFTQMRSRESAEEVVQEERNRLLAETEAKGFSRFSGVRITSTGKRFYIEDGMIWNIIDGENKFCGQAAIYSRCRFL